MDDVISSKELQVERKYFFVEYCRNERGHFLRITEESHGRRNHVIVPSTGLQDFAQAVAEVAQVARDKS